MCNFAFFKHTVCVTSFLYGKVIILDNFDLKMLIYKLLCAAVLTFALLFATLWI